MAELKPKHVGWMLKYMVAFDGVTVVHELGI
jgi:hypothetical protein